MEAHRRSSSINPASIESILSSEASGQPAAPPSPHLGSSPSRANFIMNPPRPAAHHSRVLSYTPRSRPNRLSLSFPVSTNINGSDSTRQTPSSSTASFPPTPAEMLPAPSPADPSGFLVALAGQERRVLELKEELQKAEIDLIKLKKQWAIHEAHKKRAEIKHVEPMQPLVSVVADDGKEDGIKSVKQSAELDRRKLLLNNITIPKESRRKILTGGHTRTLSLLSPERSNCARPFPPVRESSSERQAEGLSRSNTMYESSGSIPRIASRRARPLSYQSAVAHNAKLIAEDVKAGLWTFLDDLRQATVGEEGVNGAIVRPNPTMKGPVKKGSKGSLRRSDSGRKLSSSPKSVSPRTWETLTGSTGFLNAAGLISDSNQKSAAKTPAGVKAKKPISLAAPALDDLDDDWSNWDSPTPKSPRWSGSSTLSDPATPSKSNLDDRAVKIMDQIADGDEIQWPALDKLTPQNFRRSLHLVSSVMKDWEKSFTPPPESPQNAIDKNEDLLDFGDESEPSETTHEEALMMSR